MEDDDKEAPLQAFWRKVQRCYLAPNKSYAFERKGAKQMSTSWSRVSKFPQLWATLPLYKMNSDISEIKTEWEKKKPKFFNSEFNIIHM